MITKILPKEHKHGQAFVIDCNEKRPALSLNLARFFDLKSSVVDIRSVYTQSQVVINSEAQVSQNFQIIKNDWKLQRVHFWNQILIFTK